MSELRVSEGLELLVCELEIFGTVWRWEKCSMWRRGDMIGVGNEQIGIADSIGGVKPANVG